MLGAFVRTSKTQIDRELAGIHGLIEHVGTCNWPSLRSAAEELHEVAKILYRTLYWYRETLVYLSGAANPSTKLPGGDARTLVNSASHQIQLADETARILHNITAQLVNQLLSWNPGDNRAVIMHDAKEMTGEAHLALQTVIDVWGDVALALKQAGINVPVWHDKPIPIRVRNMNFSVLVDPFLDSKEREDLVRDAMDRAAAQLQRALPRELVERLPRVVVDLKGHERRDGTLGTYHRQYQTVTVFTGDLDPGEADSLDKVVNAIVHELGHFIWFTATGSMGAKVWQQYFAAIEMKVNFRKLASILDEKLVGTGLDFCEYVGAADEAGLKMLTYRTQEALKKLTGVEYSQREAGGIGQQCHACICRGFNEACVPPRYTSPFVSSYGATSAPELFAEGFAVYVLQGPAALDPEMRSMFEQLIPHLKTAGPAHAMRELSEKQFTSDVWTPR